MECIGTLALIGIGVMMASALLGVHPRAIEQMDAHAVLLRTAEAAIEDVRAGTAPLQQRTWTVEPVPVQAVRDLTVEVRVEPGDVPGLYVMSVTASGEIAARRLQRRLVTMVWRPS